MFTSSMAVQPQKVPESTLFAEPGMRLSGSVTFLRFVQAKKDCCPLCCNLSGKTISSIALLRKATVPIDVSAHPSAKVISASAESCPPPLSGLCAKAESPMVRTFFPMRRDCMVAIYSKACAATAVAPSPVSTDVIAPPAFAMAAEPVPISVTGIKAPSLSL